MKDTSPTQDMKPCCSKCLIVYPYKDKTDCNSGDCECHQQKPDSHSTHSDCERYDHVPEEYDGAFFRCRNCGVDLIFLTENLLATERSKAYKKGWEKGVEEEAQGCHEHCSKAFQEGKDAAVGHIHANWYETGERGKEWDRLMEEARSLPQSDIQAPTAGSLTNQ